MNMDFTGWRIRPEDRKILELRLVNSELGENKVTKALGLKRVAELKLKMRKERYRGDLEYNDTLIKLNGAYIYDFLEHDAKILLNPVGKNEYQIFLLFAGGVKEERILEDFETFLEIIDLANIYCAKKKAEKKAKELLLVKKSHLN